MSVPRLPSSEWRKSVEALALEFGASVEVTNAEHVRIPGTSTAACATLS